MTNETNPSRPSETCSPSVSAGCSKSDVEADPAITWLDNFTDRMAHPSQAEEHFFTRRRQLNLDTGTDENGNQSQAAKLPKR